LNETLKYIIITGIFTVTLISLYFFDFIKYYFLKKQQIKFKNFAVINRGEYKKNNRKFYKEFNDYNFKLLKTGDYKKSKNIIKYNKNNLDIIYFEHYIQFGKRKKANFFNFSAILIKSNLNLPEMFITPNQSTKYKKGLRKIIIKPNSLFFYKYTIKGKNENDIKNIFSDDLIYFLNKNSNISIEINKNIFIIYKSNCIKNINKINDFINLGLELYELTDKNKVFTDK